MRSYVHTWLSNSIHQTVEVFEKTDLMRGVSPSGFSDDSEAQMWLVADIKFVFGALRYAAWRQDCNFNLSLLLILLCSN